MFSDLQKIADWYRGVGMKNRGIITIIIISILITCLSILALNPVISRKKDVPEYYIQ